MKIRLTPILIIILLIASLPVIAFADIGPKPSIDIFVANYKNEPFYLTIDCSPYAENPDPEKMYKYENTYLYIDPLNIRDLEEYDDVMSYKRYHFGFYNRQWRIGLPKTFRIYLQYASGEIIVSNPVSNKQFAETIIFDAETGTAGNITMLSLVFYKVNFKIIIVYILAIHLTLLIEILLSVPFGIRPVKVLIITNLITQISFYISAFYIYRYIHDYYIFYFLIMEAVIWFIEYIIYKRFTKSKKSIGAYVLLANFIKMMISFIFALYLEY